MVTTHSSNAALQFLRKPDNKTANINVKNCRFKHTCTDDAGIGRRKQQKIVYRIFTCKFSISSLQCQ